MGKRKVGPCSDKRCKNTLTGKDRFCGECGLPSPFIIEEYRRESIDCHNLHNDLYADAWHHVEGFSMKGHITRPYCPMCGKRLFKPIYQNGKIVGQSASL